MHSFCQQGIKIAKPHMNVRGNRKFIKLKKKLNKGYHYVLGILSVREMGEEIFCTKSNVRLTYRVRRKLVFSHQ